MQTRPDLSTNIDSKTFRSFYYLKEELVDFCPKHDLQTSGGKIEITDRIAHFLDTGEKIYSKSAQKLSSNIGLISEDTVIEKNFVCSEKHMAFFKNKIGDQFKFNVLFQKWLKSNSGKTYHDAIDAYHQIITQKSTQKTSIDKQFEYNTYIRDFFDSNKDKSLNDAIKCWKYKKSLQGHNKYEQSDLNILQ